VALSPRPEDPTALPAAAGIHHRSVVAKVPRYWFAATSDLSFEELEQGGYILIGSPRTVVDRLKEIERDLRFGVSSWRPYRDMPHEKALKNMELFARE